MYTLEEAQIEAELMVNGASNIDLENHSGSYLREVYEIAEEKVLQATIAVPYLLSLIK